MQIRTKIIGLLAIVITLNVVGLAFGVLNLVELGKENEWLVETNMSVSKNILEIARYHKDHSTLFERAVTMGKMAATSPESKPAFTASIEKFRSNCEMLHGYIESGQEKVAAMKSFMAREGLIEQFEPLERELQSLVLQHEVCQPNAGKVFTMLKNGKVVEAETNARFVLESDQQQEGSIDTFFMQMEQFSNQTLLASQRRRTEAVLIAILLMIASVVLGLGLSVLVAGRIVRSLRQAKQIAIKIGEGDRQVVIEKSANDETGLLLDTMKTMLVSLNEAEESLRGVNEDLERKVKTRTKELARINDNLIQEIEDRKRTEEELNTFMYKTSHDLRGPVASVLGLVNLARLESEVGDSDNYFKMIDECVLRLDKILKELIDITRIKQGEVEGEQLNIVATIESILDELRFYPGYSEASIKINIPKRLVFMTDRSLLTTIVGNMMTNAIRYADPSRKLNFVIDFEEGKEGMKLNFRDNGIGMSPKVQGRLFEMFYRGNANSQGSGLGLYMVSKATEKLCGSVQVQSQPGEGTTFQVFIPHNAPCLENALSLSA